MKRDAAAWSSGRLAGRVSWRLAAALAACAALLLLQAVPGAAAPQRVFVGKTAQKRTVALAHSGGRLNVRHFSAALRCKDGSTLIVAESGFRPTPVRGRRFSDVQVGSTDTVYLRGRLAGGAVRGKLRVTDRLGKRGPRCASRWIGFRAGGR